MRQNPTALFKITTNLFGNTVSLIIMINLILAAVALFKDVFMASYLGTSSQADAFLLAYFLPDTVGNNLLASSLGIACVPVFSRLFVANEHYRLNKSITVIILYFMVFSVLLLIFFSLASKPIINNLGTGFSEYTRSLCTELFMIILPIIVAFPMITVGTSVLQVSNRFNIPALAPVLFNLVLLIGTLYVYLLPVPIQQGVYLLAASVLIGVIVMLALIWLAIRKYRIKVLVWPRFSELIRPAGDIREILRIFFPYLLILLSSQIVFTVERYLASKLEVGSIAGLNYAFRLAQFPLWVFVAAVSTVAFPSMSKATGLGHAEELKETLGKSLFLVFIVTLPLTVCLFFLRVPIISMLLQRGSFDDTSVKITAGILAGYTLTIVSQGIVLICLRAFLAIGRIFIPLLAVLISSGLTILFDYLLVDIIGSAGLGYGAAIGALVNSVALFYLINRELNLDMGRQLSNFMKVLVANLPVILVMALFCKVWYFMVAPSGFAFRVGYVFMVVVVGLPVYWVSLRLMGITVFTEDNCT